MDVQTLRLRKESGGITLDDVMRTDGVWVNSTKFITSGNRDEFFLLNHISDEYDYYLRESNYGIHEVYRKKR